MKTPIVLLCLLVFFASAFMMLIGIYGRKIEGGVRLFVSDIINGTIKCEAIPYGMDVSEDEKVHIKNIIAGFPKLTFAVLFTSFSHKRA